jgi:hypothetical protein
MRMQEVKGTSTERRCGNSAPGCHPLLGLLPLMLWRTRVCFSTANEQSAYFIVLPHSEAECHL